MAAINSPRVVDGHVLHLDCLAIGEMCAGGDVARFVAKKPTLNCNSLLSRHTRTPCPLVRNTFLQSFDQTAIEADSTLLSDAILFFDPYFFARLLALQGITQWLRSTHRASLTVTCCTLIVCSPPQRYFLSGFGLGCKRARQLVEHVGGAVLLTRCLERHAGGTHPMQPVRQPGWRDVADPEVGRRAG